ncbi:MAG: DUF3293 domain-containing protein [Pseudomonadota bacterium]
MKQHRRRQLLEAYRLARYEVDAEARFELRVDCASEPLMALYDVHGVSTASYVTAFNPQSVRHSDIANRRAHERLLASLGQGGWPLLGGRARDPDGAWPAEDSVLVLGISQRQTLRLGQAFDQMAVLWCTADAIPRLLEC